MKLYHPLGLGCYVLSMYSIDDINVSQQEQERETLASACLVDSLLMVQRIDILFHQVLCLLITN